MSLTASATERTDRMALAPVCDSHLNIYSPVSQKKRQVGRMSADLPLTPTRAAKGLVARPEGWLYCCASFSDRGCWEKDATQRASENALAGLAATKLKLKLQFAFYALQKQLESQKSTCSVASSSNRGKMVQSKKQFSVSNTVSKAPTTHRSNSANVNLRLQAHPPKQGLANATKTSTTINKKQTLSAIAYNRKVKNTEKGQNLKLFSIKKSSEYYKDRNYVPLVPTNRETDASHPTLANKSHSETLPPTPDSLNSSIKLPKPVIDKARSIPQPSKFISFDSMALPSISKILKTPMKKTSSTRSMINSYLKEQNNHGPQKSYKSSAEHTTYEDISNQTIVLSTDETIDEDYHNCPSGETYKSTRKNILCSSPVRSHAHELGTPNSFSVAKSLLQLGTGFYH